MSSWLARTGILFLCLGPLAVGCVTRDPIDRTQPGIVPKSFFVGADFQATTDDPEFHMKGYVVDNSASQSQFSVGEFTSLDRIRWEITEKMLLAHRSYQEGEGADGRALRSADGSLSIGPANGTTVAAYAIESHLDVRHSYNPSTGEEENVVEENTVDRTWNERSSMRVDWSRNLVDSTADSTRFFGLAKVTPVEYTVTDPTSDDAPHLEPEAGYLDVTNRFTLEPDSVQFPWGSMRSCVLTSFLTGSASYDCNPQESTMRFSFLRVDPQDDFERFEDTTAWRDVVGNWGGSGDGFNSWLGAPQTKWDPQYGYVDANTKRFKTIHDIWTKSHQASTCDSNDDTDANGTADACENTVTGYGGHAGSQCDPYAGRCTLPVRDREIKTIGYWLNAEVPAELLDEVDGSGQLQKRGTLEDLPYSWNQLLSVSVAYRREVECRRTGDGDRDTCHSEFFESDRTPAGKTMVSFGGWLTDTPKALAIDAGKPVFTLCHNPVRAYDVLGTCGAVGTHARMGDLRKNHLIYWPHETRAPYGGVGGNPPDPLTGESIGVTATVIGRSATYAAAMQRDVIQVLLGDLSMDDLVAGVPAAIYQDALRQGGSGNQAMRRALPAAEQAARLGSIDAAKIRNLAGLAPLAATGGIQRGVVATQERAQTSTTGPGWVSAFGQYEALAGSLRGSQLEAKVADSAFMSNVLGAAPGSTVTPDMMDLASPLRGLDPTRLDAMNQWYGEYLAAKGACFHEGMTSSLGNIYQASLVEHFRQKYADLDPKTRGERIYLDLWRDATKGIGLHEIGHSLGLRHNFASSWDAPNYDPQYWQLRTAEGTATAPCTGPRDGNDDTCMGPRYLDPMTADEAGEAGESRPIIDYFANSSTMEYQLDRFGETVGLGTYDQHAMKALYGRVLETFDSAEVPLPAQRDIAPKHYTQLQEKDIVVEGNKIFSHYTSTARKMKVFDPARDCRDATDEEKATADFRIVHGKVCSTAPKDHRAWQDFKSDAIPRVGIDGVKWHATLEGDDAVRWPYRYGEQYGSGGYMHTSLFDAGGDIYELVQNHLKTFDLAYPFQYFRRGRREWTTMNLPQATSTRFFSRLRSYHWQVALDLGRDTASELADDDNGKPYAMAQRELFTGLTRAALTPEPGDYAPSAARTPAGSIGTIFDLTAAGSQTAGNFTLGLGTARFVGDDFDNELGGSWDYQKYLNHAGFEMEKAYAVMQLVDSRPTLFTVQRDNYLDDRGVYISFRSDMQEATDRFLGAVLAEDWETVAPAGTGSGEIAITYPDLVNAAPRPSGSQVIFPNVGYKQQLSFAMYSAIFSRLSSDMSLVHKLRIWIDGDAVPTPSESRQVRFTDPTSGYTYVANAYGSESVLGKEVDRGIGSRMLQHANALLASTYVMDDTVDPPVPTRDADGQPVLQSAAGDLALRRYVGLLDALRQIDRTVGGGPLGGAGSSED